MVGFGDAVKMFFTRYVDFEGRSTRAEYWWFFLFYWLVIIGLFIPIIILAGISDGFENDAAVVPAIFAVLLGVILFLFIVICIIPSIALAVRRFHDLNQTGWLYLVFFIVGLFIPFAGLIQIIWFIFPGTVGPNQYGEDPYDDFFEVFE